MTTISYDDEIDIREYIDVILRNRWKIMLIGLVFAVAAFAVAYLSPKKYETSATIVINRNQLVMSLAKQYPTVALSRNGKSFAEAIYTLAGSDAVAQRTIEKLGDKLPTKFHSTRNINKAVSVSTEGDALVVKAVTGDKNLSSLIANTWADEARDLINTTYSGGQPLSEIQSQLSKAKSEYDNAQKELEDFFSKSNIKALELQSNNVENQLGSAISDEHWKISYNINRKHALEHILAQAKYLKNQIGNGAESLPAQAGDALAMILVRNQILEFKPLAKLDKNDSESELKTVNIVGVRDNYPPSSLSVQLQNVSALLDDQAKVVKDLSDLILVLEKEIERVNDENSTILNTGLEKEGSESARILSEHLRNLVVYYEKEKAKKQELTNARDLAWTTYKTLQEKKTEIESSLQASAIVSLASKAIVPQEPKSSHKVLFAFAGLVAGIAFGCFVFFVIHWWKDADDLDEKLN